MPIDQYKFNNRLTSDKDPRRVEESVRAAFRRAAPNKAFALRGIDLYAEDGLLWAGIPTGGPNDELDCIGAATAEALGDRVEKHLRERFQNG